MKYTTVMVGNIITRIAKTTDVERYTEGVLEILFPDDMSLKKEREWIKKNNKRMEAICKFLNDSDL